MQPYSPNMIPYDPKATSYCPKSHQSSFTGHIKNTIVYSMDETLTMRIPASLKKAVDTVCRAHGTTITSFVREALVEKLNPPHRAVLGPGFTEQFDRFI